MLGSVAFAKETFCRQTSKRRARLRRLFARSGIAVAEAKKISLLGKGETIRGRVTRAPTNSLAVPRRMAAVDARATPGAFEQIAMHNRCQNS